ncbi:hypothetical protein TNCT_548021 [Trichonephila clavata]|uniref:Uncharacterized protein n=1 Tax=Trichonephila clavata TaxID=2740835 RepID=A0A8X6LUW2_TRICU|nr:hypothetical protein TNCT_548021 [Trichonephila clavata]
MQDTRRERPTLTTDLEKSMLNVVDQNPGISVKALAVEITASASTMYMCELHCKSLYLFSLHLQKVQTQQAEVCPGDLNFAQLFLQKMLDRHYPYFDSFANKTLFTNEGEIQYSLQEYRGYRQPTRNQTSCRPTPFYC